MEKLQFMDLLNHIQECSKKVDKIDFYLEEDIVVVKYLNENINFETRKTVNELYSQVNFSNKNVNEIKNQILEIMFKGKRIDVAFQGFVDGFLH